ncbi:hypothetical protein RUMOBE_03006 [Blautia obeum ATCC 29174]|uniref:Uncharacterized protein n=1 Tax=Blautia obeum ATCC 29174 TaxID=411459 RepID=A5ZVH0_9FIRM|nr:hypothetical protein RUMOBE_03006 [Blautia obeum ATCC 29174]
MCENLCLYTENLPVIVTLSLYKYTVTFYLYNTCFRTKSKILYFYLTDSIL